MLTLAALAARKHVLVEKPAYLRLEDYETVRGRARPRRARRARRRERSLQAACGARCGACCRRRARRHGLRALHDDRPELKAADDWRNDEEMAGGDAFFEEGIHWLHLANSLGPRIVETHGYRPAVSREGPDTRAKSMLVSFTYDNGAVGSLYYSREIPSLFRGLRLSKLYGRRRVITSNRMALFVLVRGEGPPQLRVSRFSRYPRLPVRCIATSCAPSATARAPEMSLERPWTING